MSVNVVPLSMISSTATGSPACDSGSPAGWLLCHLPGIADWPAAAGRAAVASWPWLGLGATVVLAAVVVVLALMRVVRDKVYASRADGGYCLEVQPPRLVRLDDAERTWRVLKPLVELVRKGRRTTGQKAGAGDSRWGRWMARPALAVEFYARAGEVRLLIWLPGYVSRQAAAAKVEQAWPGCRTSVVSAPAPPQGLPLIGLRLRNRYPDDEPLADADMRSMTSSASETSAMATFDPLSVVWTALRDCTATRTVIQILVAAAPFKRVAALRITAGLSKQPVRLGGPGDVGGVLLIAAGRLLVATGRFVASAIAEFLTPTRSQSTGDYHAHVQDRPPVDPVRQRAASAKYRNRPHFLVAIRVAATASHDERALGRRRSIAGEIAGIADGFEVASKVLSTARLARTRDAIAWRFARRRDWSLCTAGELAVVCHLPANPDLYGIRSVALERPAPTQASRIPTTDTAQRNTPPSNTSVPMQRRNTMRTAYTHTNNHRKTGRSNRAGGSGDPSPESRNRL